MRQPRDVDGDGVLDPIDGCENAPWGWTNGNGGGNGNGNAGGNGNGQGPCGNNGTGGCAGPEVFESDQYFYHPDHLGSSSYVTDIDGEIFQHLEYFPFGETWVEESSNTQRTPYLFTGKELDEQTGLYYFGARYYDPRTSVWQSPDPILAKYLNGEGSGTGVFTPRNLNLFGYVHQRPVVAIDPNGMEFEPMPASQLWYEAWKQGATDAPSKFWLGGDIFESASLRSMGLPKNTGKWYSEQREALSRRGWSNTIPDAVVRRVVSELAPEAVYLIGNASGQGRRVGFGLLEVKGTGGEISMATADYQIRGQLDALSRIPMLDDVPKEYWLVTPSDASIGQDIIDFATENDIALIHSTVQCDYDTGQMRVMPGEILNPSVAPNGGAGRYYGGGFTPVPLVE